MKQIHKKFIALTLVLTLLGCTYLLLCGFTQGQKVYDDAGLLTQEEITKLEEEILQDAQQYSLDLVIVTTRAAHGKTAEAFADDFYDEHAFGYDKPHGNGILLLIDMNTREYHLSTSGDRILSIFTDASIDKINRGVAKELSNGRFYEACQAFLAGVTARMDLSASGSIDDAPEQYPADGDSYVSQMTPAQREASYQIVFVLLSLGIATVCLVIMNSRSKGTKATSSTTYLRGDSVSIRQQNDIFLRTQVTHRTIPRDPPPSSHTSSGGFTHGGGGGSFGGSSHSSGGGFSHGGGGGKF